jgi:lysophospholipase L1-like esterase
MDRLLNKAKSIPCWGTHAPNILVICPPHIGKEMVNSPIGPIMGIHCAEKSAQLAVYMEPVVKAHGFAFLDAEGIAELNQIDYTHLTRKGHADLANHLAQIVPGLV